MRILVLISADAEWTATLETLGVGAADLVRTPYGDCFTETMQGEPNVFLHGGWGKVAAAASAEYAISRWNPEVILNLGTCGGIKGQIIREVSDLVSPREGEVLGNLVLFRSRAAAAMRSLLNDLCVLVPFLVGRLSIAPAPRSA